MPSHAPFMMVIQTHSEQIRNALGPEKSAEFDSRCGNLFQLARDQPDKTEEVYYHLLSWIKKYPAVVTILSPEFPALQDSQETTSPTFSENTTRLAQLPVHRETKVEDGGTLSTPSTETEKSPSHTKARAVGLKSDQGLPSEQRKKREDQRSPRYQKSWGPEQVIQFFKEIVTAIMGFLLVGYTLYMLTVASGFVGDPKKLPDAKDLLQLLLGLTGVVLGYYFGRIPSDARAAQAQQQAEQANAKAERISVRTEEISRSLDDLLTDPATTRGDEGMAQTITELRKLRNELRNLSSYSQLL